MVGTVPKTKEIFDSILNSYAQVFFSRSRLLALFLLVISFFDYGAGLGGLVAVIIAILLAWFLGYNKYLLTTGLYGFNALLVGLGVGLFYQPSVQLYLLIAIAAITCFFLTIVFQGVLGKYGLPFLSVPFLLAIWIVALSGNNLTALNISERGIYVYNELYALGGKSFVDFYDFLERTIRSSFVRIYFHSLGAIFFQSHLLAGIIISAGLLIYSRITFVLSVFGYSIAYLFYLIVGIEFNSLSYTFIGFNYILTAIALGGYYLVPNRVSFGWIALLLPAVVLITISTQEIFLLFKISPYSLPFNVVVLMFLYALKLREKSSKLIETPVQLGKPEKNFYLYSGNTKRFPASYPVSASLPFFGEWKVSQGHNGEHTHKGEWKNAWDFVITDKNGKQFKGTGDFHEDYFCFDKAVLAPCDGTVAEAISNIADNTIGDINTKNNWGNTVVIKHNDFLYSKLSHLKYHSVEVKAGDTVKQGQIIGRCGNSGRSPYPHLHFQFQATPYIGSATLDYPVGHYLLKNEKGYQLKTFGIPTQNETVANPAKNEILKNAFHFIPGQRIKAEIQTDSKEKKFKSLVGKYSWVVETDVYNTTFLRSESEPGKAYLYNNDDLFYFTNFTGKTGTPLYWFFTTFYKIPLGFLPHSKISDTIPVNLFFRGITKFLQDFIAPVFLFLKVDYHLYIKDAGDILSSGDIEMETLITTSLLGRKLKEYKAKIKVGPQNRIQTEVEVGDNKFKMICGNEL